jgi:hypothetical protein
MTADTLAIKLNSRSKMHAVAGFDDSYRSVVTECGIMLAHGKWTRARDGKPCASCARAIERKASA